jgi:AMP-binding enzyme C-terminal domain
MLSRASLVASKRPYGIDCGSVSGRQITREQPDDSEHDRGCRQREGSRPVTPLEIVRQTAGRNDSPRRAECKTCHEEPRAVSNDHRPDGARVAAERHYTRLTTERCGCGRTTARAVGGMYGRMDDMLSLHGTHIYPSAIEDVVRGIADISEAYEVVVEKRDGQDHVIVCCEPRPEIPAAQWTQVEEKITREVSSALEVKVAVDLKPYGTISREFKAKRIHDLRRRSQPE